MPEWKREIREALAGTNLKVDGAREEAVVEELAQDLAERYEDLVREGVGETEALRRLRGDLREPGFLAGLRPRLETRREAVMVPGAEKQEGFLAGVQRDVRIGVRLLRANPAFALVAILSLALGIGANTAIFELLDAVLLRTLSVAAPEQLAEVRLNHPGRIGSSVARQQDFQRAMEGIGKRTTRIFGDCGLEHRRIQPGARRRSALRERVVGERGFLSGAADKAGVGQAIHDER